MASHLGEPELTHQPREFTQDPFTTHRLLELVIELLGVSDEIRSVGSYRVSEGCIVESQAQHTIEVIGHEIVLAGTSTGLVEILSKSALVRRGKLPGKQLTFIHCIPPLATPGDPILTPAGTCAVHFLCFSAAGPAAISEPPTAAVISAVHISSYPLPDSSGLHKTHVH